MALSVTFTRKVNNHKYDKTHTVTMRGSNGLLRVGWPTAGCRGLAGALFRERVVFHREMYPYRLSEYQSHTLYIHVSASPP